MVYVIILLGEHRLELLKEVDYFMIDFRVTYH